ncbi:MAG TPA: ABC transporter permease, partial [Dongiaceae bacterium]
MVERSRSFDLIAQAILFLGLVIALLPFIIVAIAASHDLRAVNQVPMPLTPGSDFIKNVIEAWQRADLGL